MKDHFTQLRQHMVRTQLEARDITDLSVLEACLKVPRHLFVPEHVVSLAYEDGPLEIGLGQTISQPYIVAYMTQHLQLKSEHKVLEIGTGSGYQTAILAELVDQVYTIELLPDLARKAQKRLSDLEYSNIKFRIGNGYEGWPEYAPFDRILLTAAPATIPEELVNQLADNGVLLGPIGRHMIQYIYKFQKSGNEISKERLIAVRFVDMVKRS
ncbi:MAG: protein-L-isoaspartate(D-aspartate) O-methyltransferase [Calditrichia bacterium]